MKSMILCAMSLLCLAGTNRTYTVKVPDGAGGTLWQSTNVVAISNHAQFCTLITYVEGGTTNEFHVAFVPFIITTNN